MLTRREFLLSLAVTALEGRALWGGAPNFSSPPTGKPGPSTVGGSDFAQELTELRARRPVPISDRLQRFSPRYPLVSRFRLEPGSTARGEGTRRVTADWPAFTTRLKHAAQSLGAALVGVTRVDPLWLYLSDGQPGALQPPAGLTTAVVLAVKMDDELLPSSLSPRGPLAAKTSSAKMSAVTTSTAHFLTDLGWRAEPSGNDTALSVPLAIDAGLGELGRNGLLITRQLGPQVRLGKVFTDAPLVPDAAITFGVRTYCELCGTCARECPSGAISRDEPTWAGPTRANNPGALKWYINPGKCWAYLGANGMSCARCVHGCLFNKPAG